MSGQHRPNIQSPGTERSDVDITMNGDPDGFTMESLNDLIVLNRDSVEGYKLAAEHTENEQLKTMFERLAQERHDVVGKLSMHVANLGGDPDTTGSVAGMFHRAWINIKSAVTSDDEEIIEECIVGEETLRDRYEEVLTRTDDLTPELVDLLRTCASHVSGTIGLLKNLDD